MTSLAEKKPLNRQEFSYYLFFTILFLFLTLIAVLSLLYAIPRLDPDPIRIPVGTTNDFPSLERPYPITAGEIQIYIVRTETGWLALDRRTPYSMSVGRCRFVWTEANGRFEDPCSGSKFSLHGQLLEGPATQNLDQYPITEQSRELFVDLTTLITGETSE